MTHKEWCDVKTWKLALVIGGLTAVAVFGAAAVAFGGGVERAVPLAGNGGGMMFAAEDGDSAESGWRGCGGSGLMQDPQAREDMLALREEHRAEMSAWYEKYGEDPTSDAAQKALDELRDEHHADMLGLFEQYGVTPPEGFGEGERGGCGLGAGPASGGCGGRDFDGQGFGGQGMMGGGQDFSGGSL
jgi:hypothetical protein